MIHSDDIDVTVCLQRIIGNSKLYVAGIYYFRYSK